TAGDEQGTGGECGDAGEPLPSADRVIAGPFGKWVLHERLQSASSYYCRSPISGLVLGTLEGLRVFDCTRKHLARRHSRIRIPSPCQRVQSNRQPWLRLSNSQAKIR